MRSIKHIALSLLLMLSITGVSVETHYCEGSARYSTIAVDNKNSSCCGDEMQACPTCRDEVNSSIVNTPTTFTVKTSGVVDLPNSGTIAEVIPPSLPDVPVELLLAASQGPPGVTNSSTIPILISSFLI